VLSVADDGVGFDTAIIAGRVTEGHIGLASLINGIEAAGGTIEFDNGAGAGTLVTVTVSDIFGPDGIGRS
jgi:two-component system NarL family sensor kinase